MRIKKLAVVVGPLVIGAVAACSSPDAMHLGAASDPLWMATPSPDTTNPAVGYIFGGDVGGCTGTLIAPDVVITAAHCMPNLASGCSASVSGIQFYVRRDGNPFGTWPVPSPTPAQTWDDVINVVDFAIAPSAILPRYSECPGGSGFRNCSAQVGNMRAGNDIALLKLARSPTGAAITPAKVVTSITDSVDHFYTGWTGATVVAAHAAIDSQFDSGTGTAPTPVITGWGWGNLPAPCNGIRGAGNAQFEARFESLWRRGCNGIGQCLNNGSVARSDVTCRMDGLPGSGYTWGTDPTVCSGGACQGYMSSDYMLRIARSGVTSGPYPRSGDSGGPLLVPTAGHSGNLIWGVLNGGNGAGSGCPSTSTDTSYRQSFYAATFSPENGRWIESVLSRWQPGNVEYSRRANGWKSTWLSNGGGITAPPGAVAYGYNDPRAFVRGSDGKLWQNWATTSWQGPLAPSRTIAFLSEPSVVSWAPGRLDVFARSDTGTLMHLWYQDGFGWSDWEDFGGFIANGTGPAATTWGVNRLDVFFIGGDQKLYRKYFAGSGWLPAVGFEALGGPTSETLSGGPTAIAWSAGRIDVFAQTASSKVAQLTFEDNALGWQGSSSTAGPNWTLPVTSGITSPPIATSWMPGRIDVFWHGGGGTSIFQWTRKDGGWGLPTTSGAPPAGGGTSALKMGASSYGPGRIDLYGWGASNDMIHTYFPSE